MHRPDDVDVRIIKELGSPSSPQWNVRESYARIGRRVGVDEETVRKRILRMRQTGALPPWCMKPNPAVIGRQLAEIYLDLEVGRKPEAIAALRRTGGVVTIKEFLGPALAVSVFYVDDADLDDTVARVASACGSGPPVVVREPIPSPEVAMRTLDWRIVAIMADDARMDLREVAERIGATPRTVQRRLAALMQGRAVFLSGRPEYRNIEGLFCDYLVRCPATVDKEAIDAEVLARFRQRIVFSLTTSREFSTFVLVCANPAEADATAAFLRGLAGVDRVRMGIMKELIHVKEWLQRELDARASLGSGPRAAVVRSGPSRIRGRSRARPAPAAEARWTSPPRTPRGTRRPS